MTLPIGSKAASAISLSPNKKLLVTSDLSKNPKIYLFELDQIKKDSDKSKLIGSKAMSVKRPITDI